MIGNGSALQDSTYKAKLAKTQMTLMFKLSKNNKTKMKISKNKRSNLMKMKANFLHLLSTTVLMKEKAIW